MDPEELMTDYLSRSLAVEVNWHPEALLTVADACIDATEDFCARVELGERPGLAYAAVMARLDAKVDEIEDGLRISL